jgi:copper transport protein
MPASRDRTLLRILRDTPALTALPALFALGLVAPTSALPAEHTPAVSPVHTRLLGSLPAAGEVLSEAPERFELRFSGPVNGSLSAITLVYPSGDSLFLSVANPPDDETLLIAGTPDLESGLHVVRWRTVSRDGHPVDGEFRFTAVSAAVTVTDSAQDAEPIPEDIPDSPTTEAVVEDAADATSPLGGAILGGFGLACLLGFAGLLWYVGAGPLMREPRVRVVLAAFGWGALILLGVDLALWLLGVRVPGAGLDGFAPGLASRTGVVATGRLFLLLLALLALRGRGRIATFAALFALLAGAATGHPAAISPLIALPASAVHLGAVSIWLGGLFLLVLAPDAPTDGSDTWRFEAVAGAVSAAALLAVILIFVSGGLQSFLFVGDLADYPGTPYGRVVLLKWAGFATLVGFGAYHRFRVMPGLAAGGGALRRTVRLETTVMLLVIMVAAVLARMSPPEGH